MKKFLTRVVALASAAVMALGVASAGFVKGDNMPKGASVNDAGMLSIDLVEAGYDPTAVTSVTISFTVDDSDGFGGGIMLNSSKSGWHQQDGKWDWGNEGKNFTPTGSNGSYSLTFPIENAADEFGKAGASDYYAQVCVQQWWGKDITLTSVEIADGSDDGAKTDDGKKDAATPTGDATSVAVLAIVALVALGGVVVTSKKNNA